jgi:hypothetical protein
MQVILGNVSKIGGESAIIGSVRASSILTNNRTSSKDEKTPVPKRMQANKAINICMVDLAPKSFL